MAGAVITGTIDATTKPNQSKVFYHANSWWGVFEDSAATDWYVWERVSLGHWNKGTSLIDSRNNSRLDAVLDAANNRVFVLQSNSATTRFSMLDYVSGVWTVNGAYTPGTGKDIAGMNTPIDSEAALCRDPGTGKLLVSVVSGSAIKIAYSSDNGITWSAATTIKSGLLNTTGLSDCIVFTWNGTTYFAVVAGVEAAGDVVHFLKCPVTSDPSTPANWSDETSSLPAIIGGSDNHVCIAKDTTGGIYVAAKSGELPLTSGQPILNLYKRDSGPSILWTEYTVATKGEFSPKASRPWVLIDSGSGFVYVGWAGEGGGNVFYRKVAKTELTTFLFAAATVIITSPGKTFKTSGVGVDDIDNPTAALVYADNLIDFTTWENQLIFFPTVPDPVTGGIWYMKGGSTTAIQTTGDDAGLALAKTIGSGIIQMGPGTDSLVIGTFGANIVLARIFNTGSISFSRFNMADGRDPTKLASWDLSALTSLTTRVISLGDYDGFLVVGSNIGTLGQLLQSQGAGIPPAFVDPPPLLLSRTTGIDAKTIATRNLYTSPNGTKLTVTMAVIRCTSAVGAGNGPTLGIGIAAGEDDIIASTALATFNTSNTHVVMFPKTPAAGSSGSVIVKLGIDLGATVATSMNLEVDLFGYYI